MCERSLTLNHHSIPFKAMSASSRLFFAMAAVVPLASLAGCKNLDPPPPPPFQIFVRIEGDPGQRVQGAVISRNTKTLGTTGPDGRAMLTLTGSEGESIEVIVKCPDAFQSPNKPLSVRLTRFADKTKVPEYAQSCPPALRRVVVAVKADNGPNLPVVYLNHIITRTDASGAAHFALEVAPGSQFQVTLDTQENPKIKPPSPSRPFTAPQHDEILVFDQHFDVEKDKVRAAAKPSVPRALN